MIKLHAPYIDERELASLKVCLDSGWIASSGEMVDAFEKSIADFTGAKYAVSVINGTSALFMGLKLAGVGPSDIVLLPNLTFVASVNAVKYLDATPVFVDVDPETWQMDLDLLENFLQKETQIGKVGLEQKNTKQRIGAVVPVHILGGMCDMERLISICKEYRIPLVEDAAQALGSYYNKQHSGTFGLCGTLSFNGNKIITTGGGGMLLTNDKQLYEKAIHLIQQAKTSKFEYVHDEVGYNYRLSGLLASVGRAQLDKFDEIKEYKAHIFQEYNNALKGMCDIVFQKHIEVVDNNRWLFTFLTDKSKHLRDYLMSNGVEARPLYTPMNRLPMFKEEIYFTEKDWSYSIFKKAVSIPSSAGLTEEEQREVIQLVKNFYK